MTFALKLATVADSISKLSITGVTIRDKDEIAASWISCPNVLYPRPDNWITNFRSEWSTMLRGAYAPTNIKYTLNYRFLGLAVGDASSFPAAYSDLMDKLILIINAVFANDSITGAIDVELGGINQIAPLQDPAGNTFLGVDIPLNITEMQN